MTHNNQITEGEGAAVSPAVAPSVSTGFGADPAFVATPSSRSVSTKGFNPGEGFDDFDRVMDTLQLIISIKGRHVLTDQEADDIRYLEAYYREHDERATEAFDRGYQYGLKRGGGADTAKLIEERDQSRSIAAVANAVASASERWAFINGAQACREMIARFVEATNPTIANSIRLNWKPSWGDDPGAPTEEKYADAAPCEISAKARGETA